MERNEFLSKSLFGGDGGDNLKHVEIVISSPLNKILKLCPAAGVCVSVNNILCVCRLQECDQVHIDDVSSDDNGQDLRYRFEFVFLRLPM